MTKFSPFIISPEKFYFRISRFFVCSRQLSNDKCFEGILSVNANALKWPVSYLVIWGLFGYIFNFGLYYLFHLTQQAGQGLVRPVRLPFVTETGISRPTHDITGSVLTLGLGPGLLVFNLSLTMSDLNLQTLLSMNFERSR